MHLSACWGIGGRVHVAPCNLAEKEEVEPWYEVRGRDGKLDILVANAGITRDNLLVQLATRYGMR